MSFADRLTRTPRAYEEDRAAEMAERFSDLAPELRTLIANTAGCSPYLRTLAEREESWLRDALSVAPEDALAAVHATVAETELSSLGGVLRGAKRRVALLSGLADLGGVWALEAVTGALTDFADLAVNTALHRLVAAEITRGKLPGLTEKDAATAGGYFVIAMGKMGAHELNYSSDIDLICLFDETRIAADDYNDVRAGFVRITRRLTALLSDITKDGYVFRTDLRLRPDASVTPVVMSMHAAENYYESLGRTWERAAYIKARVCAGDIEAGQRFLDRLKPFVWRRHLDYAAIQDAHDMRLRIRDHKGLHRRETLEGHDMKLGSGGIREIEFFTQTRQIIAGGRDPRLQVRETVKGLQLLTDTGWEPEAAALIEDYRAHREVEHRLQMIADQQTHKLPTTAEGFARLAAFLDCDEADLRQNLRVRLDRVAAVTETFFAPANAGQAPARSMELSPENAAIVARWPNYPALRSARAVEIFARLKPGLLERLSRAANPGEALVHLDGFLAGLPAGVQLFSLFEANPQLMDLIVDIAATSPSLAQYLSRNSEVLDAVIGGDFFADWPGPEALRKSLRQALDAAQDYESQLDVARRWHKEWHFRVGVHHLRGLIGSDVAARSYADLADVTIAELLPCIAQAFAEKHGGPPGRGAAVLGMGSLGAQILSAGSDLDLIVIYDADGVEASSGRRPLDARSYFARFTQAMVTGLSAPTAEGKLYEVDMRLRPSGKQGPVATGLDAFKSYQLGEAWTWEHLALTRARVIAGAPDLGADIEAFRATLLGQPRDRQKTLADVADMRVRLAGAKPNAAPLDMKLGQGRSQDIALLAQAAALLSGSTRRDVAGQLRDGHAGLGLSAEDAATLTQAADLMARVQAASKLVQSGDLEPEALGAGAQAFLLREAGFDDMASLRAALDTTTSRAAQIVDQVLAPHTNQTK